MRSPKSRQAADHLAASRSWPTWTSPRPASRRTVTARSRSAATSSTSASRRCPPSTASASSCVSCARTRSCCGCPTSASCRTSLERFEASFSKPYGAILVTGPDRLGQVDVAVRGDQRAQRSRTGTSSPPRTRSSTGCPGVNQIQTNAQGGPDLRRRAALVPALLARRHPRRRDPRPGDREDRDRVGAHRPPRALDAAHQRRRRRGHPSRRDGRRAVPRLLGGRLRARRSVSRARLCTDCKEEYTPPKRRCSSTPASRRTTCPRRSVRAERLQEVRRTPATAAGSACTRSC